MRDEQFHILLADDDESDRLIFKEALEELRMKPIVHTTTNGIELMAYLTKKKVRLPDLIFLDINMPRKNGIECLKEIRGNKKLRDISIAIYTTSANEKDVEETFHNGANVYITKPSDIHILKQLLNKAVEATQFYRENTSNRANFLLKI